MLRKGFRSQKKEDMRRSYSQKNSIKGKSSNYHYSDPIFPANNQTLRGSKLLENEYIFYKPVKEVSSQEVQTKEMITIEPS